MGVQGLRGFITENHGDLFAEISILNEIDEYKRCLIIIYI